MGCPYLQQCQETLKIEIKEMLTFKEAWRNTEAAWEIMLQEQSKLQCEIKDLKDQLLKIHTLKVKYQIFYFSLLAYYYFT